MAGTTVVRPGGDTGGAALRAQVAAQTHRRKPCSTRCRLPPGVRPRWIGDPQRECERRTSGARTSDVLNERMSSRQHPDRAGGAGCRKWMDGRRHDRSGSYPCHGTTPGAAAVFSYDIMEGLVPLVCARGVHVAGRPVSAAPLLVATRRAAATATRQMDRELRSLARDRSDRLVATQEALQRDVLQAREASLLGIAEAASGLKDELGAARRTLVEVRSARKRPSRRSSKERAAQSLGSSGGGRRRFQQSRRGRRAAPGALSGSAAAGDAGQERHLRKPRRRVCARTAGRPLPPDRQQVAWRSPSSSAWRRLTDEAEKQRLRERDRARTLRSRAGGAAQVPRSRPDARDRVWSAVPDAVVRCGSRGRSRTPTATAFIVVPYSLTLPFALGSVPALGVRFSRSPDDRADSGAAIAALDAALLRGPTKSWKAGCRGRSSNSRTPEMPFAGIWPSCDGPLASLDRWPRTLAN